MAKERGGSIMHLTARQPCDSQCFCKITPTSSPTVLSPSRRTASLSPRLPLTLRCLPLTVSPLHTATAPFAAPGRLPLAAPFLSPRRPFTSPPPFHRVGASGCHTVPPFMKAATQRTGLEDVGSYVNVLQKTLDLTHHRIPRRRCPEAWARGRWPRWCRRR
jgi:hypothetical protein